MQPAHAGASSRGAPLHLMWGEHNLLHGCRIQLACSCSVQVLLPRVPQALRLHVSGLVSQNCCMPHTCLQLQHAMPAPAYAAGAWLG